MSALEGKADIPDPRSDAANDPKRTSIDDCIKGSAQSPNL